MKIIIHIPKHANDLDHNFPVGERQVSLATYPCVGDVVQLDLNDDQLLFTIQSVRHQLTMQDSTGNNMEAETHIHLQSLDK